MSTAHRPVRRTRIAAEADCRFVEVPRSLSPADWSTPTELPGWDVKAIACHVLGEAESYRIREALHLVIVGRRRANGRALIDGMYDAPIADRAHLTPAEILERSDAAAGQPGSGLTRSSMSHPARLASSAAVSTARRALTRSAALPGRGRASMSA